MVVFCWLQETHTKLPSDEASPLQRAVWNQGKNRWVILCLYSYAVHMDGAILNLIASWVPSKSMSKSWSDHSCHPPPRTAEYVRKMHPSSRTVNELQSEIVLNCEFPGCSVFLCTWVLWQRCAHGFVVGDVSFKVVLKLTDLVMSFLPRYSPPVSGAWGFPIKLRWSILKDSTPTRLKTPLKTQQIHFSFNIENLITSTHIIAFKLQYRNRNLPIRLTWDPLELKLLVERPSTCVILFSGVITDLSNCDSKLTRYILSCHVTL